MADLTLADARRVIAAAEQKALEVGRPENIAVVDDGAHLVAHIRMDGAWRGSVDISNRGRVMVFAGGVLLERDGRIIGAIGVSGGTGDQDEAVAEAGAARL